MPKSTSSRWADRGYCCDGQSGSQHRHSGWIDQPALEFCPVTSAAWVVFILQALSHSRCSCQAARKTLVLACPRGEGR